MVLAGVAIVAGGFAALMLWIWGTLLLALAHVDAPSGHWSTAFTTAWHRGGGPEPFAAIIMLLGAPLLVVGTGFGAVQAALASFRSCLKATLRLALVLSGVTVSMYLLELAVAVRH